MLAGPRDLRLTPEPRGRPRDLPVPLFTADPGAGTVHTVDKNKQGSFVTVVLSAALTAILITVYN